MSVIFYGTYFGRGTMEVVKTIYQKVNILSEPERAYLAGIIDGEGTVTLSVKQKGGTRHLSVSVSGTEWALMSYLPKVIGAGRITNKRVYKQHHTPAYTYSIYSRQAIDLLDQILPYLRTYKAMRARLALDEYILVTPRNGKYSIEQKLSKDKFVEKFLAIIPG